MTNLSLNNLPTKLNENATNGEETICVNLLEEVDWGDLSILLSFIILGLINILVIGGNTLVILAVYCSTKLRTVTNFFIVSLAVADLLVGVLVLPFSTTYEVLDIWVFGYIWCKFWLAIDVWMCTSSILNLCAISLDRYLAVTRPVSYPSIMSSKRAKILIAAVWVVSFIICFPPLVGWNESGTAPFDGTTDNLHDNLTQAGDVLMSLTEIKSISPFPVYVLNDTEYSSTYSANGSPSRVNAETTSLPVSSVCGCELISDPGYRIYSSLGSFYLPMLVMMFFYWKIYRAAVKTTKAINQGFKTTKCEGTIGGRFDEQRMTLRIHRGKSTVDFCAKTNGTVSTSSSTRGTSSSNRSLRDKNRSFVNRKRGTRNMKTSASFPPPEENTGLRSEGGSKSFKSRRSPSASNNSSTSSHKRLWSFGRSKHRVSRDQSQISPDERRRTRTTSSSSNSGTDTLTVPQQSTSSGNESEYNNLDPSNGEDGFKKGAQIFSRMGKRNIKAQVKRFKTEKKAAKTLGIIVGGFILCWFPFFTIYMVGAFCDDDCIPQSLFSVFFWLGYCNSAINPCLYALFSRDFRYAFKKILCKCILMDELSFREKIVTMIPAVIHLNSFNDESEGGSDDH